MTGKPNGYTLDEVGRYVRLWNRRVAVTNCTFSDGTRGVQIHFKRLEDRKSRNVVTTKFAISREAADALLDLLATVRGVA